MTENPCAKINIGLNIVSRRADGYHNLETVFYPIPLYDRLTIEEAPVGGAMCRLETTGQAVDCAPEDNLVVKAYHLLSEHYPLPPVTIRLHKGIPSQAGLGGGSSDVGFAIRMLNEPTRCGAMPAVWVPTVLSSSPPSPATAPVSATSFAPAAQR